MEQKQRFFIYDRKELWVLLLLGVMVSVFAFTLGVHLGKRIGPGTAPAPVQEAAPVATTDDQIPNRQELAEQGKNAKETADESLSQAVHEEVGRTGIKLEQPRQVDLPEETRSAGAGKAPAAKPKRAKPVELPHEALMEIAAARRPAPDGKFTLQIGSFPALDEARDQSEAIEALGLKPFLRPAEVRGKGLYYRVFLGGYPNRDAAEKAGQRFVAQHVVESFVVANLEP
jgi:cell division septation protein DedD